MKIVLLALRTPLLAAVVTVGALGIGSSGLAQDAARLGKVDFKVECSAEAQQQFNHAMALYHSFAWAAAAGAFEAVANTDPACGMAHWGRAMTMLDNPFVWPANLPPEKLGRSEERRVGKECAD